MDTMVEDMANRLLKRKPEGFGPLESRVPQSRSERTAIAHDTNKAVAFHETYGDRIERLSVGSAMQ